MDQKEMLEQTIKEAAKAAHEVNKVYCEALGDYSQSSWEDAPDWQKKSAISGVKAIIDNPQITPEMQHECWLKIKRDEGWVYDKYKDVERKVHPCMVPYEELPTSQRTKDTIFGAVVRGVLAKIV